VVADTARFPAACLAPVVPTTDLPSDVLAFYRAEIGREFEVYFAAVSQYVSCLDRERERVLAEAQRATSSLAELFNRNSTPEESP
jgi:hypothetical protein